MPPLKELHYFDQRIHEPSFGAPIARLLGQEFSEHTGRWYASYWQHELKTRLRTHREKLNLQGALWDFRYFARSPSDRWYTSLFKQGRGKITGEITPEYSILEEETIAHIHELIPNVKIIFLLRNPIERDYSGVVKHLHQTGQRMETAPDKWLVERFRSGGISRRADYLRILDKWRQFYPDEQIFVGFLEDIHFYPARLLRRLCKFLGADASYARKAVRRKVHSISPEKMPTPVAAHLARRYREDLYLLSERFNGYASFWHYCAERLANDTLDEDTIPYPLWDSWLWEDWIKKSRSLPSVGPWNGKLQSRSLG
jgi:hypothetical protein